MRRQILPYLTFLAVALTPIACGPKASSPTGANPGAANGRRNDIEQPQPTPRKAGKPVPPLTLAAPAPLPDRLGETDLGKLEPDELSALARQAAGRNSYAAAAACQYWFFRKTKTGQYDLACYLARTGQTDPAFYWLQVAAIKEGVDTRHARRDEDLESLRRDPRWEKVVQYLQDCNDYFETAPISRTVLVLPKEYKKPATLPAVLWMHGLGSRPEDFINDDSQDLADRLNVALIGVSGTKPRGPRSFVWAEDAEADGKRLRDALAEVSDRVTIAKGQVITFGFSQGAQAGLEVAVRYPEEFAGAIVLSPGAAFHLQGLQPSPLLAGRGYVLSCGAEEHPGNVRLTAADADWLRRAKARVLHKPYPGVSAHAFPQDFEERFPEWVSFILQGDGR